MNLGKRRTYLETQEGVPVLQLLNTIRVFSMSIRWFLNARSAEEGVQLDHRYLTQYR